MTRMPWLFQTKEYSEIFLCLNVDVLAKGGIRMAGSYGAEATQGERYRLSFTVGGLLASQGRALAEMYLNHLNHAGGGDAECSSQTEVGKSIAAIRQQAIEENVLAIRTDSANRRVVAETTRRLSALTVGELAYLAGPDSSTSDREALMWIAMCRYYAIIGEFAGEVLKKHFPMRESSL